MLDLGISQAAPGPAPIQEEKPPRPDANGIPGAPWHSDSVSPWYFSAPTDG